MTSNPRRIVTLNACHFALFPIPTITLFWQDQIGMSLTDIMVLQAVFGVAVVVLEFPTGYFADRVGYRASMLVGAALWGAGWFVYALGETFGAIVVAEIVCGAGAAFISGADRALLWLSLEATDRVHDYTRWESRLRAAAQTTEAASAAVGGWLYAVAPRLPLWMQLPAAAVEMFAAFRMKETARPPIAPRSHVARALHVARATLWRHRRLRAAITLSVTLGLSTFVMVWLVQSWMQSRGIPPGWFGPLWAAAHVWLAAVTLAAPRIADVVGARGVLLLCCVLIPVGYGGLAWSTSAWAVVFYLCFMTIRGLQLPILSTVMQQEAPGEDRATVLSLAALVFRFVFVVTGPLIGALADRTGLDTALAVTGAGFTAASLASLALFTSSRR
ncbi:MAG: MFS transporter [Candidatus Rokubacteria bacterium]|nr:MFS transporter [Candidatus Rokubacteria bacterium]